MPVICEHCRRDMLRTKSCDEFIIGSNDGKDYRPIPFGQEVKNENFNPIFSDKCPDCGVKFGGFHHPRCDWEECPICHGQIISCYCHEEGD